MRKASKKQFHDIIVVNREMNGSFAFVTVRTNMFTSLLYPVHSYLLWNATQSCWEGLEFGSLSFLTYPCAFWWGNKFFTFSLNKHALNPHKLLCSRISVSWMSLSFIIHYFSQWKIKHITVCVYYIFQVPYDKKIFLSFYQGQSPRCLSLYDEAYYLHERKIDYIHLALTD